MRFLKEHSPPQDLIDFLSKGGDNYNDAPKEAIQESLISEQQALCAYCM